MNDNVEVKLVRCDQIIDRDSYRTDYGDLSGLIESISERGLLQPILISETEEGYVLLAGRRRLAAVRSLNHPMIRAMLIPIESNNPIEIQCDENAYRKPLTPMEAVYIARRLKPLVQAAAEQRWRSGQATNEEKGSTRELVARRVNLSHETLRKAEYVLDHLEALQARVERSKQTGTDSTEWQALVAQLEDLVERMNSSERKRKLRISTAYTEAKALIAAGKRGTAKTPPGTKPRRVVRYVTDFTAKGGQKLRAQVSINLSMDNPSNDLIISALQETIASLVEA